MVMKRAFLFASLCLSLAMGESVLVRSDDPGSFAAGQQSNSPSFQSAKVGDEREVGWRQTPLVSAGALPDGQPAG